MNGLPYLDSGLEYSAQNLIVSYPTLIPHGMFFFSNFQSGD